MNFWFLERFLDFYFSSFQKSFYSKQNMILFASRRKLNKNYLSSYLSIHERHVFCRNTIEQSQRELIEITRRSRTLSRCGQMRTRRRSITTRWHVHRNEASREENERAENTWTRVKRVVMFVLFSGWIYGPSCRFHHNQHS